MLKKFFLFFTVICILAAAILFGILYKLVVLEPGEEIQAENIHRILGKESHVYYSDGMTRLGVFFDTAHRQYVSYSEIPHNFVNALVASEDNRFFDHLGFDVIGIGRAMIKNIEAGRIVQGGSTLTQQTAKNLFKRTERSFEAKLKELLFALRLEYYYPKEKIFEFYANQFYVSGNGHGLGVAARYYFDKKPGQLTLAECAFIAGSVKRPNYYNPFIKKTEQAAEIARTRATIRLRYVLGKMRELGMIDSSTYKKTLAYELQFNQGKVGYALDHGMELVRDAVSSTEVLTALEANEITNIATSGVRVITTIDKALQEQTLSILRGELSRLDVRLRGFEREEVQAELADLDYSGDSVLRPGVFLFGTIEKIEGKGKELRIFVSLDKDLGPGVIAVSGLSHIVKARVKWQKNLWSEPEKRDLGKLVAQLQPGDRAWVSVEAVPEGEPAQLLLQKYPEVQGAALVMKDGIIKGMAGGTENRFFNRAIHAKRTVGSAFKPLVYTAAMQLGWNSADLLKNSRDVFVYHRQPYFPRPDHISPHTRVSMSWAGVKSENVASVWLLSHLCDQLKPLQLRELAGYLGLTPKMVDGEEEPYRAYKARIRDKYGIRIDRGALQVAAYRLAVDNLETDFIFDGMVEEYQRLKELPYGLNYDKYSLEIKDELKKKRKMLKRFEVDELKLRRRLLANHYLKFRPLRKELASYRATIESAMDFGGATFSELIADGFLYLNPLSREFIFLSEKDDKKNLTLVDGTELQTYLLGLGRGEVRRFWKSIRLDTTLTAEAFDMAEAQIEHEYQKLLAKAPYSFEVLSQADDFRITLGLYYLINLAQELGIKSSLDPVLSFPLGSNVVTLIEATRMYGALVSGTITTYGESEQEDSSFSLAILDRIESEEGKVLYKPKPVRKKVVDAKTSLAIGHILENVVKFGTGRGADKTVRFASEGEGSNPEIASLNLTVPLLGKTGTANRYTNASFLGYLPGIAENGVAMTIRDGYAVGVYVGYDDNKSMRRKTSRISGAAGALPTWSGIVNVLLKEQQYASRLDPVDLSFNGLGLKRDNIGQMDVGVDPGHGGRVIEPVVQVSESARYQPSILTFGRRTESGRFVLERTYQPFWKTAAENEQ
jgi:penicillin-binding protein 1A